MKKTIEKFTDYLYRTTGITLHLTKWSGKTALPYYLNEIYAFYKADILDTPVVIMEQTSPGEQTPATIKKHCEQVNKTWQGAVIYLSDSITPYNRKRLIEHKVPFVIPDNQMYLPDLGIDLREHFRQLRSSKISFSPSTQVLVLYALINKTSGPFTPAGMAAILNYTPMTLGRAFDELEAAGICEVKSMGRERFLTLPDNRKELWDLALPYMKSPVRTSYYISPDSDLLQLHNIFRAGLPALSVYSMLADPGYPVMAIGPDTWNSIKAGLRLLPIREEGAAELQVWRYSPETLSPGETVDIFSLYLSLMDEKDERIQKALSEMMEGFNW
jgi:DNA-binding MarR family transcriptional regulator